MGSYLFLRLGISDVALDEDSRRAGGQRVHVHADYLPAVPHQAERCLGPPPRGRAEVQDYHSLLDDTEFLVYVKELIGRAGAVALGLGLAVVMLPLVLGEPPFAHRTPQLTVLSQLADGS